MPDFLNGLFFSEILADNAGGGAVNVNGQGGTNKQDEFVEIQNNTSSVIDLGGYQIWSDKHGLLHSFSPGDEIQPGGTATVVGTYNNPPAGFYGANGNNNSASGNGGFLEDGEGSKNDTLYLVDPDGDYIRLSYGQNAQVPSSLPSGFPAGGSLQGAGEITSSGAPNATSILRDADGELVEGTPTAGIPGLVCFAVGTVITTCDADVAVEDLRPGRRVPTLSGEEVTLRAVRRAPIGRGILRWNPDLRPVLVPAGALGNTRPLHLSPAHRVLLRDARADFLFGSLEVLAPVRHLVGYQGIHVESSEAPVTYFHLLFDRHEVIRASGCWSESLFLGEVAHAGIDAVQGWQVQSGIDLATMSHDATARPVLKRHETALLLDTLAPLMQCMKRAA